MLPSGVVKISVSPALDAAFACLIWTLKRAFARRSFPSNPSRLSPSAPSKNFDAIAFAAFAFCVESSGFSNAERRLYWSAPVASSSYRPLNIPSLESSPEMRIVVALSVARVSGSSVSSVVPSGCTTSTNSPCSLYGSSPYGVNSDVRSVN